MRKQINTAKGRKISSTHWLERQINDVWNEKARQQGYRSRASYKLLEIDHKFKIFKQGQKVLDLGAAPGGWSQVAVKKVGKGNVNAIDLLPMEEISGVGFIQGDFEEKVKELLESKFEQEMVYEFVNVSLNVDERKTDSYLHKVKGSYINALSHNLKALEKQNSLCDLKGNEFPYNVKEFVKQGKNFLNQETIKNVTIGSIILSNSGLRKTAQNLTPNIACALRTVPDVLKNGIIISKEQNWKNREYNGYLIVGTISIARREYIVEIIVKEGIGQDRNGNKTITNSFYLENVINKKEFFDCYKVSTLSGKDNSMKSILGNFVRNVKLFQSQQHKVNREKFDVIMSDMAVNTMGDKRTDHLRTIGLVENAFDFAIQNLNEGGVFISKVFQGKDEPQLFNRIKEYFSKTYHFKPESSRKESVETYIVGIGLKFKKF